MDPDYNLDLICEVVGNEVCKVKVPRSDLDDLDLNVALEMAFEQPELEKRISRKTCAVVSYRLEPGYEAVLNLKCLAKEQELAAKQQAKAAELEESSG